MSQSDDGQTTQERSFSATDVLATRRTVLAAGAVAAAGIGAGKLGAMAQDSTSTPSSGTAANACVLTPELTEGPYFLDGDLIRQDITDA
jgi:hypothetical protein